MKKIFFLVLLFFLFSCYNEYYYFHVKKHKDIQKQEFVKKEIDSFNLNDELYLSWVEFRYTPDLKLLDDIVYLIDNSQKRVYLEVYIFTEKRIRKAIKRAYNRWVDVKVLLEKNVYKAPYLNNDVYKEFKNIWIDVRYSGNINFYLNHSKLILIDDLAIVSTWNYSYSTFKYNREFFLFLKDKEFLQKLEEIFLDDFNNNQNYTYHKNLVLSPFYTDVKFEKLIKSAKNNIKIYFLNFSTDFIKNLLLEQKQKWISINFVYPSIKEIDWNKDIVEFFLKNWFNSCEMEKIKNHAKAILVDDKYLYLGSINFSDYSIYKNREIWVILSNKDIIKKFLEVYNIDCKTK